MRSFRIREIDNFSLLSSPKDRLTGAAAEGAAAAAVVVVVVITIMYVTTVGLGYA